jgi:ribonuclease P protein component
VGAHSQRQRGRGGGRRRLSRSADFDRVFREGRSFGSRHLVLHAFPRRPPDAGVPGGGDVAERSGDADSMPRLGVSVGRRVGSAVERNRVKRLLREAFWSVAPSLQPGYDFVLVARPDAAELARREGEPAFEADLRELVARAGLET